MEGAGILSLIARIIALALVACGGPEQGPLYGDGQPGHQPDGLPIGVCRPVCDHRPLPAVENSPGCRSGILSLEVCPDPHLTVDMCVAACNGPPCEWCLPVCQ